MLKQKVSNRLIGPDAIAHVEKRMAFPMEELCPFPKYLLIETVNTCNARCIMCGIDFDKKSKVIMKDELFEKIIEEIGCHSSHVEKVMLYLDGEPLIDNKLARRVRMTKESGVKTVTINTNAQLLDEKRATELIEAGLDEAYITIDSLKKDVFEEIRVRLDFETVYNNTRRFIELRNRLNPDVSIRIQMVQQELNYDESSSFLDHWNHLLADNDQAVVRKAHNWGNAAEVMFFGDEDDINNIPCIALWGTFVTHVNGDAALCCMDSKTTYKIGNLTEESIEEIWTGDTMNTYRKKHLNGRRDEIAMCDGCTVWREEAHVDNPLPA